MVLLAGGAAFATWTGHLRVWVDLCCAGWARGSHRGFANKHAQAGAPLRVARVPARLGARLLRARQSGGLARAGAKSTELYSLRLVGVRQQ